MEKNSIAILVIISYLPDKDALSLANAMLLRMGGQPIKESDLYSSPDTSN
jgi:hypothetical protein